MLGKKLILQEMQACLDSTLKAQTHLADALQYHTQALPGFISSENLENATATQAELIELTEAIENTLMRIQKTITTL